MTCDRPLLSIVIVNADGEHDTIHCLQSIVKFPPSVLHEIILIDNCSKRRPGVDYPLYFDPLKIITAQKRQGFSKNYNLGLREAVGDYRIIMNNDTIVHEGMFDAMIQVIEEEPGIAFAGPRMLGKDGKLQTVCARPLLSPVRFILEQLFFDLGLPGGRLLDKWRQFRISRWSTGPVPCISGACMMARKEVLEEIGLLDERYTFYFEDVEWCHRAKQNGYKSVYVSNAVITHLGDRSLSKVREWAKQSEYHSAQRYFKDYYDLSAGLRFLVWMAVFIGYLLRWVGLRWIRKGQSARHFASVYWNLAAWMMSDECAWGKWVIC